MEKPDTHIPAPPEQPPTKEQAIAALSQIRSLLRGGMSIRASDPGYVLAFHGPGSFHGGLTITPYRDPTGGEARPSAENMTLRDHVAAQAIPGVYTSWVAEARSTPSAPAMAREAYALADAMLAAREEKHP